MSAMGRISFLELRDLFLSFLALAIAFSVLFERTLPSLNTILVTALGVGTGFILHEMAHKFTAQHFGYFAEYRANMMGLGLAIVSAFAGILIAAPGAVMISRPAIPTGSYPPGSYPPGSDLPGAVWQDESLGQLKRESLLISLSGPGTNIVLALAFFLLGLSGLIEGEIWARAVTFALYINLILAAFNMLPFGPLDGKKVFDANRIVWALVGLPMILIALPIYLGIL